MWFSKMHPITMTSTARESTRSVEHCIGQSIGFKYKSRVLFLLLCILFLPEHSSGTYAVITVDVCWTCGDDFQATWNGKDYGVPLIVEKLEAHGFKGTFFVLHTARLN